MKPIQHPSNNARLTPPPGVSEEQCDTLHITRVSHPHPIEPDKLMAGVISYWQPEPLELAALNAGMPVLLSIWGATHPPVAVGVEAMGLALQTGQVTDVMQLAESVGLIGPASRTGDLHAAIERFAQAIQSRKGRQRAMSNTAAIDIDGLDGLPQELLRELSLRTRSILQQRAIEAHQGIPASPQDGGETA